MASWVFFSCAARCLNASFICAWTNFFSFAAAFSVFSGVLDEGGGGGGPLSSSAGAGGGPEEEVEGGEGGKETSRARDPVRVEPGGGGGSGGNGGRGGVIIRVPISVSASSTTGSPETATFSSGGVDYRYYWFKSGDGTITW